jgi:twitching motility protein PilI
MALAPAAAASSIVQATGKGEDAAQSRLGLQLGEEYWLLDLNDVAEVIPVPELLSVPLTKPWLAGLANIRGNLVVVVDFAAFVGAESCVADDKARLVLVGDKHRINSALVFNRVVGLRQLDSFRLEDDAPDLPAWVHGRYRDGEERCWHALNMHALVTHPDFLAVELHSL